jgi:hypothetical protein
MCTTVLSGKRAYVYIMREAFLEFLVVSIKKYKQNKTKQMNNNKII